MGASHRNDSTLGGLKIGQSENELLGQFDEKRKQLNLEVSVDADFISRDERQFRLYPLSCEIGLSAEILGFQRQFNILPTDGHWEMRLGAEASNGVFEGFCGSHDPNFRIADFRSAADAAAIILTECGMTIAEPLAHQL